MYDKGRSGQTLGFSMISALSGTALTGLSGFISGWRSTDGGGQKGISGNIIEMAFGQYVAILNDWDVSGNTISFYFTGASGAIPVEKTIVTDGNVSGKLYPVSGQPLYNSGLYFVGSGSVAASVTSGGVYLASGWALFGSGQYYLPSGQNVQLFSGSLSGQLVALASGLSSGVMYLPSGSLFMSTFASGVVGGGSGNLPSAWGGSGAVTVGLNLDKSGYTVGSLVSGILSGQQVTLVSGQSYTASGIFATATAAPQASGQVYLASGSFLFGSGQFFIASGSITSGVISSGIFVTATAVIASGALSGQQVTLTSGQSYVASGINATVPIASISGAVANSGLFVSVPVASISGVYPASGSLSGQPVTLLSGLSYTASGIFATATATIASGALSGQLVTLVSGQSYTASGIFATATAAPQASGTTYLASGSFLFGSGQFFVASGSITSGVINSGIFVTATASPPNSGTTYLASGSIPIASLSGVNAVVTPASLSGVVANSGLFVTVPIATVSGTTVATVSGTLYIASGTVTGTPPASGTTYLASGSFLFGSGQFFVGSGSVTAAAPASGTTYLASGTPLFYSGLFYLASGTGAGSGLFVTVPPSTLSGVVANSGIFATVPPATLSGVQPISGAFVTVPVASISGTIVNSGLSVTVPTASISGVNAVPASGLVYLASGVPTVGGKAWTQALDYIAAVEVGLCSGANTGSEAYFSIDKTNVRVTATIDQSGNRTAMTYT